MANMNTLRSKARLIETRYVWGPDIESCMKEAQALSQYGAWHIEGNPAPMTWAGQQGTGVAISRVCDGGW